MTHAMKPATAWLALAALAGCPTPDDDSALEARLAQAEATIAAQAERIAVLEGHDVPQGDAIALHASWIGALESDVEALRGDLDDGIATYDAAISDLNAATDDLDARLSPVEGLAPLAGYLSVDTASNAVLFQGANVYVQSGSGATDDADTLTGLGNLVIGYDEADVDDVKSGSHNLVIGMNHTYESWGGIVAGYNNAITGENASVLGGLNNVATGYCMALYGAVWRCSYGRWRKRSHRRRRSRDWWCIQRRVWPKRCGARRAQQRSQWDSFSRLGRRKQRRHRQHLHRPLSMPTRTRPSQGVCPPKCYMVALTGTR